MFTRSTPLSSAFRGVNAGDVNGDGYDDVIAVEKQSGIVQRLLLFSGGPTGIASTASWTYTTPSDASSLFAKDFAAAGDINGDGYDDFIIGDAGENTAQIDEPRQTYGEAFVFLGSPNGPSNAPDWTGHESTTDFGAVVASALDVNGDGYDDVLVATPGDHRQFGGVSSSDCSRAGAVYIYHGSPGGPSTTADWSQTGQSGICFGFAAAGIGDVDGDGYNDVIVGATWDGWSQDSSTWGDGRADVYFGSAQGLQAQPGWSEPHPGTPEAAIFGVRVAGAGDVNADGLDDVLIGGAVLVESGTNNAVSKNFLFLGQSTGLSTVPDWEGVVFSSSRALGLPGYVSSAGDINADGYADVLAPPPVELNAPTVSLFHGYSGGLHTERAWTTEDKGGLENRTYSAAGDVDGDGYDDVVVSQTGPGVAARAKVYYGGPNPAPVAQPQSLSTPRGTTLDITLEGSDRYDDRLEFAIEGEPNHGDTDGLSLYDGELTYAPEAEFVGTDSFTFSVTDPYGNTDTATVDIEVTQGAPVFVEPTPEGPLAVEVGETLEFVAAAEDPEDDRVTYRVSPRPDGASIDLLSGEFSWRPTSAQAGDWSLELSAADGHDVTTRTLSVGVTARDEGDAPADAGDAPDAGADAAPDADADTGAQPDAGHTDARLADSGQGPRDGEGCGCTSSGTPRPDAALLFVLLAVGVLRRRSDPRSAQ